MKHLKSRGLWENTINVLTSDHGEMIGDHGMLGKGGFFPESQHVPLVIRVPGQPEGQTGNRLTSSVDLLPTLLDIWDISPTNSLDGSGMVAVLSDASTRTRKAVLWEFDFRQWLTAPDGDDPNEYARGSHLLARLSDDVLQIRSPNTLDLMFDLTNDPTCSRNVLDVPAFTEKRLEQAEALIHDRQRANDQTLCNTRLTSAGPAQVFGN